MFSLSQCHHQMDLVERHCDVSACLFVLAWHLFPELWHLRLMDQNSAAHVSFLDLRHDEELNPRTEDSASEAFSVLSNALPELSAQLLPFLLFPFGPRNALRQCTDQTWLSVLPQKEENLRRRVSDLHRVLGSILLEEVDQPTLCVPLPGVRILRLHPELVSRGLLFLLL